MMLRGDGWEVSIQEVFLAGRVETWRPVVFFLALLSNQGVGIQVYYLDGEGRVSMATSNKLRQVGA